MSTDDCMSTDDDVQRAVVFQEGENLRAVATWHRDPETKELSVRGIELEMLGTDAMGAPQWNSCGWAHGSDQRSSRWIAALLIGRTERWLKENV